MRYQGQSLVTPVSPKGILDFEFARTAERFMQLRLFLNPASFRTNIYLDFLFIGAYVWFLASACGWVKEKTGKESWSNVFTTVAISAGFFDICENFLLILIFDGKFDPSVLEIVFYCALIKFILAGLVVIYLLVSIPALFKRK